ncbi:MAG: PIN domain-containing protein, partial [Candidatus Bathyarchaeales archaeon]
MSAENKPAKRSVKIILDSNAFFVPLQFRIDIFEELKALLNMNFEVILLSPIRRELEKIAGKGSPKMRKKASFALKLAEKCKFFEVNEKFMGSPDDAIVQMAQKWNCPV